MPIGNPFYALYGFAKFCENHPEYRFQPAALRAAIENLIDVWENHDKETQ